MLVPGITYSHEHIALDLSAVKKTDDTKLDCIEETIQEFHDLYAKGVRNVLEVSNRGMGRDIKAIQRVSQETGIQIICSTGYYKEPFFPPEVTELSEEELTRIMVEEIEVGIEGTKIKAGIIGEIGSSLNRFEETELKVFRAAGAAQKITHKPLITHTSLGTLALEQIAMFREMDIDLDKIIISHVDLSGDVGYIEEILKTGVNVAFDTIGKTNYQPDELRVDMLKTLCEGGYSHKILLSLDITRKSNMKHQGGIGYAYLVDTFLPRLREAGISEMHIQNMTQDNIIRILEEA